MKSLICLILLLALTPALAADHLSIHENSIQKTIKDEYSHYRLATLHHDVPTIMSLLTTDFTWHQLDGKVLNREQTRGELKDYFRSTTQIETMTITLQKIAVNGNVATTRVTEKVTALTPTPDHKFKRSVTTETYREVWIKTDRGWKIQDTHVLKS